MTSLEVTIIFQFGVGFKDFLRLFHFKRRVNNRPTACDEQNFILLKMDKLNPQYMYIYCWWQLGIQMLHYGTQIVWACKCLSPQNNDLQQQNKTTLIFCLMFSCISLFSAFIFLDKFVNWPIYYLKFAAWRRLPLSRGKKSHSSINSKRNIWWA